eukprot:CAMPEP_0172184666 /NCGR_PEP_ID=MMETSP1050-20130122/19709_1 /TAXON_ID=233186 /ORGANISM="Cryptomonas curvata, Strain CCAP979/52" /LENGTH=81 /DNA_ID=CAMNT_0012858503 /DNA_START=181 /DNA_END=422 /DNA_ORIENTATION=+
MAKRARGAGSQPGLRVQARHDPVTHVPTTVTVRDHVPIRVTVCHAGHVAGAVRACAFLQRSICAETSAGTGGAAAAADGAA